MTLTIQHPVLLSLIVMLLAVVQAHAQPTPGNLAGDMGSAPDLVFPAAITSVAQADYPRMLLLKPDGAGPFPAVMLGHQCGGLVLRKFPYVMPDQVAMVGYSQGALIALFSNSTRYREAFRQQRGFDAYVSFYPPCRSQADWARSLTDTASKRRPTRSSAPKDSCRSASGGPDGSRCPRPPHRMPQAQAQACCWFPAQAVGVADRPFRHHDWQCYRGFEYLLA